MRVLRRHILRIIAALLLCCACSKGYVPDRESSLVVEGWIEDGGYPLVMVTRSVPTSLETVSSSDLADYIVRWAKVSVSDGDTTVMLTGKADKDYPTQYLYTTTKIMGQSGKSYTLEVSYRGASAKAVTMIPEGVKLESLSSRKIDGGGDGKYYLEATFSDVPGRSDYYRLFSMIRGKETAFTPCFMGTFDDAGMSGTVTCSVFPGNSISTDGFNPYFIAGDEVRVKLCTMDSSAYAFWKGYDDLVSLSKNPLFPVTVNPASNMIGALGYWAGYGCDSAYTVVGEEKLK